jgi:hypothetical protein
MKVLGMMHCGKKITIKSALSHMHNNQLFCQVWCNAWIEQTLGNLMALTKPSTVHLAKFKNASL